MGYNCRPQHNFAIPTVSKEDFTLESTVVAKDRALLGYYAASSGNFLPTFRDKLSGPILRVNILTHKDWANRLSRNSLRNNPEERSCHLLGGGSLKSRNVCCIYEPI